MVKGFEHKNKQPRRTVYQKLLGFLVLLVHHASFAILVEQQASLEDFFVLMGKIVNNSALRTFELNHVVLRHMGKIEMWPSLAASTIATNNVAIIPLILAIVKGTAAGLIGSALVFVGAFGCFGKYLLFLLYRGVSKEIRKRV